MIGLRWLSSKTVRQANALAGEAARRLDAEWDLLSPEAREAIRQAVADLDKTIRSRADSRAVTAACERLESVAGSWLKPHAHAGVRESVDSILVALVVALAIRTFFLQPMAIPTGSMQPTLYGIMPNRPTYEAALVIPSLPVRIFDYVFRGVSYHHVVAEEDGAFGGYEEPRTVLPLVQRQRFRVGSRLYSVWFPPERLFPDRVPIRGSYRKGEDILKLKVTRGDRLFVDRFTYNFGRPTRGEIVIFRTDGINGLEPGTHYIKRLIGRGGDAVRLLDDRHVELNGRRLSISDRGFENVYSFDPALPPRENEYCGHVNETVAESVDRPGLARQFPDEETVFKIRPGNCLVFGDNTMNSKDSRDWGDFPIEKIIGRSFFVFWPISPRIGWGVR